MKALLHAWSVGRELVSGSLKAGDLPARAAERGFAGVEWLDRLMPSFRARDWEALGQAQQRVGLETAALSLGLEILQPPMALAGQVDRAKAILGLCPMLKVKAVRVSLGGGGFFSLNRLLADLDRLRPRRERKEQPLGILGKSLYRLSAGFLRKPADSGRPLPARANAMLLQSAAWALQPLARQAGDLGLVLGLENHFGLTSHVEDILQILELAGTTQNNLGVCLDTGNFSQGQDPAQVAGLLGHRTVHVHFKTLRPDPGAQLSGPDRGPKKRGLRWAFFH